MYAWIWRHLPFGLPGRITGSVLLIGGAMAVLWFLMFPWLDPFVEQTLLPWNEGQLDGDFTPTRGEPDAPASPGIEPSTAPSGQPLPDNHDIPYETDE
jgi:hypothetical protein